MGHRAGVIAEGHWLGSLVRAGSLVVLHLLSVLAGRKTYYSSPRAGAPEVAASP